VGEFDEAVDGHVGVVLCDELEFLLEECGAELSVGLVLGAAEDGVGFFRGDVEVGEHLVELGVGLFELVGEGAEGRAEG
jgi:hypothetical protein